MSKSFTLPDHPAPIQVIETLDEQHQFRLDEEALEKVLLSSDVIDMKVRLKQAKIYEIIKYYVKCIYVRNVECLKFNIIQKVKCF